MSFLRLTPGVASSVALSFFWHFAQTMVVSGLHWTVLIGVAAGGWILGLDVQVGGYVIRHRLVFDAKTLTEARMEMAIGKVGGYDFLY